jgi:soluble lytic murein transglycosylase-like protein
MRHCARRAGGCEAWAARLAAQFMVSARAWELDEWLLAAIAARESSLVETARGALGERGIMQLAPHSPAGLRVQHECGDAPCLAIEVDAAAELLARSIALCGSEASALARYNSGRCSAEGSPYARSVLRLRDAMKGGV